jgi:hypothetical protein
MISRKFQMNQKTLKEEVDSMQLKIDAEKRLLKAEIPTPKKPSKKIQLEFPDDLTDIPDKQLGQYLGVYESQASWIGYCIARREIDYDQGKLLLDYVYSKLMVESEGKLSQQKASIESNTFYVECKLEFLEIEADLKLLRASLDAYERYAKAISREISNRGSMLGSFPTGRTSKTFQEDVFNDHRNSRK